jgi:hypothetical protein
MFLSRLHEILWKYTCKTGNLGELQCSGCRITVYCAQGCVTFCYFRIEAYGES